MGYLYKQNKTVHTKMEYYNLCASFMYLFIVYVGMYVRMYVCMFYSLRKIFSLHNKFFTSVPN